MVVYDHSHSRQRFSEIESDHITYIRIFVIEKCCGRDHLNPEFGQKMYQPF